MGLTNSFGGCIITVNMPAPAEALRSGARLNQSGSIAALNLFESHAKRDTLIDRVVSFGTVVPKSTTSKIPVLSGEVLKTPVALDYTTGVINVTPPTPEDPRKDLSHDLVEKRSLSPWRRTLITLTAVASGLTAVGTASPSPTKAGDRMLMTAGSEGINCVEDESLLVIDFKYAAELVKGIASGEIVIAVGPVPVAALEEGDKTAVVEPITISPEEVWQNLVKVVPECPPVVVEPTPTPKPTPDAPKTPAPEVHTIQKEVIDAPYQKIKFKQLNSYIHRVYAPKAKGGLGKAPSDIFGPENEYHERTLEQMETILSWTQEKTSPDPNPETRRKSRMETVNQITVFAYKVYKESASIEWLSIAQKSFWYGETEFGKDDYQKVALPKLEGL